MKNKISNLYGLTLLGVMLFTANLALAQTAASTTTTTTTSDGTVSQFGPDNAFTPPAEAPTTITRCVGFIGT